MWILAPFLDKLETDSCAIHTIHSLSRQVATKKRTATYSYQSLLQATDKQNNKNNTNQGDRQVPEKVNPNKRY